MANGGFRPYALIARSTGGFWRLTNDTVLNLFATFVTPIDVARSRNSENSTSKNGFQKKVNRDISLMTDKLDAAQRNKTKQEACLRDRSLLPESKYKRKSWVEAEAMLCQQSKLKPSCDFKVYVKAEHASPQGRNHYEREWPFGSGRILPTWNYVQKRMREKQARQAEIRRGRAKVTPKLRYEILKRDGCRCQICGSEQSDGVKLHVDHIKPVSKGGKTTRDNLRTLCDRCNQGKGNEV